MGRSESMMDACDDFCQELTGESDTSFNRTYQGDPPSRIICRGLNLTVMADLSPLCHGHILLVSNRHYFNFAEVARDHLDELADTTAQILKLYRDTFGEAVILEHGSVSDMQGSSCITHAHWHILPLMPGNLVHTMETDGLESTELHSLNNLAAIAVRNAPYFLLACASFLRLFGPGQVMRQQYLRSIAGKELDIPDPEWDWALIVRKHLLRANVLATQGWKLDLSPSKRWRRASSLCGATT